MDPLTIAVSGVRSAEVRLASSAHNVANLTTDSFRPLRTEQTSVAGGGSVARLRQETQPRPVELTHEILEQIRASLQFKASLRVFATTAEMRGQLVDLLA